MNPKNLTFRKKVRQFIHKVCQQRLLVIRKGQSKVPITYDQCKKLINDTATLISDRQLASYITREQQLLFMAIPGVNINAINQLRQLLSEAHSILNQPQNITQK